MHTHTGLITHDDDGNGIDRRGFLRCMAWAGTGIVWGLNGGIPTVTVLNGHIHQIM